MSGVNRIALIGTVITPPVCGDDKWSIEIETEPRLPAEYNPLTRFVIYLHDGVSAENRARLRLGVKVCVHGDASPPNRVDARAMWVLTAAKQEETATPLHGASR
jgi:hypothetical protein